MTVPIPFGDFERIYPTENDIAFADYNGVNSSEINFTKNLHARNPHNAILANLDGGGLPDGTGGFEVIKQASGLNVGVQKGRAYISGRYIEILSSVTEYIVACDADSDVYVFLQLNISGVVNVSPPASILTIPVSHGSAPTIPVESVMLALVVTDSTDVLTVQDFRPSQISNISYTDIRIFSPFSNSNQFTKPKQPFVKMPVAGMAIGGNVIIKNESNGNSMTANFDLTVEGPFGVLSKSYSTIPASDDPYYVSVYASEDIGRFVGNCIKIYIENVVVSLPVSYSIMSIKEPTNQIMPYFNYGSTWSIKEWDAIG